MGKVGRLARRGARDRWWEVEVYDARGRMSTMVRVETGAMCMLRRRSWATGDVAMVERAGEWREVQLTDKCGDGGEQWRVRRSSEAGRRL